nr:hypothetical protein TorRG33x02_008590 [Ipomoea batatas]GMC88014.1 hypothetical protein TorRG33x02_008590 [Ipomoea batatas]GME12033.1 hypothetical protein TorRG33x02_008590 [Ipomoea batatas]
MKFKSSAIGSVSTKRANLLFVSSRSHSFTNPDEDPAATKISAESKAIDSTGLVWPDRVYVEVGLPMDQRFTL